MLPLARKRLVALHHRARSERGPHPLGNTQNACRQASSPSLCLAAAPQARKRRRWKISRVRSIGILFRRLEMASEFKIEGECDKRFENVKKAFAENFHKRGELGAAVSIVVDGKPMVELWGGHADKA